MAKTEEKKTSAEPNVRTLILSITPARAQTILSTLRQRGWVDERYQVGRADGRVLIPLRVDCRELAEEMHLGEVGHASLEPARTRPSSLQEELAGALTPAQLEALGSSFDIIGDIAMLELGEMLDGKESVLADALMRLYPHVRAVVKKSEGTGGPYRIRPVVVIGGEPRTHTVAVEDGCRLHVDLNKAYYNPRMNSERLRVIRQIKPDERVLVLFAGIGPYAILADKRAEPEEVVAIELNPDAAALMGENIKTNRCRRVRAICADAAVELAKPLWKAWADRTIMPHPSASLEFLSSALSATRTGGTVHLYAFASSSDPIGDLWPEIEKIGESSGCALKLAGWRLTQTFSPTLSQVALDLRVERK